MRKAIAILAVTVLAVIGVGAGTAGAAPAPKAPVVKTCVDFGPAPIRCRVTLSASHVKSVVASLGFWTRGRFTVSCSAGAKNFTASSKLGRHGRRIITLPASGSGWDCVLTVRGHNGNGHRVRVTGALL